MFGNVLKHDFVFDQLPNKLHKQKRTECLINNLIDLSSLQSVKLIFIKLKCP